MNCKINNLPSSDGVTGTRLVVVGNFVVVTGGSVLVIAGSSELFIGSSSVVGCSVLGVWGCCVVVGVSVVVIDDSVSDSVVDGDLVVISIKYNKIS